MSFSAVGSNWSLNASFGGALHISHLQWHKWHVAMLLISRSIAAEGTGCGGREGGDF